MALERNIPFSLVGVFLLRQEQYSFMLSYALSGSGDIEFSLIPFIIISWYKSFIKGPWTILTLSLYVIMKSV